MWVTAGFLSCNLNGSLPFVWCHITIFNSLCLIFQRNQGDIKNYSPSTPTSLSTSYPLPPTHPQPRSILYLESGYVIWSPVLFLNEDTEVSKRAGGLLTFCLPVRKVSVSAACRAVKTTARFHFPPSPAAGTTRTQRHVVMSSRQELLDGWC